MKSTLLADIVSVIVYFAIPIVGIYLFFQIGIFWTFILMGFIAGSMTWYVLHK